MEIVNSASDSCELSLGSSSLEQEELQVLDMGPGGEGKFPFLLLGLGVSIFLIAIGMVLSCIFPGLVGSQRPASKCLRVEELEGGCYLRAINALHSLCEIVPSRLRVIKIS